LASDLRHAGTKPAAETSILVEEPDFPPLSVIAEELGTQDWLRCLEYLLQVLMSEAAEDPAELNKEFCFRLC
jgi:hypothetical protein